MTVNLYTAPFLIAWWSLICALLVTCLALLQMSFVQLRRSHADVWKSLGEPHVLGDIRTTYPARKFVWSKECRALNDDVLTRRASLSYYSGMTAAVLGLAMVATVVVAVVLRASSLRVPEIVRGATAGGGIWGACPDSRFEHSPEVKEAISPEFNARLAKRFPRGSSEQILIKTLKTEGFGPARECDSDHSIKESEFRLNGNEVVAQAYWKAESNGTLVWTKGFVAYTFL